MSTRNVIQERSFSFALSVIRLYQQLVSDREYILSKQLLRSGTSIGANVREAVAAQSRRDFLSKMSIASKEAHETIYWLELLQASDLTQIDVSDVLEDSRQIQRILVSIVKTTAETS
jgi:four helix bundle protein